MNDAVESVIKVIVKNSQFDSAIKVKNDSGTDITELEKEVEELRKHIRQLTAAKDKLGGQIDRLDPTDKFFMEKCVDMQHRLDSLYEDIAEVNASLEDVMLRITGVKEQRMSKERVYEFLQLFDKILDKFTDAEKKEFLQSFVKMIEIYQKPLPNGQILKSIQFHFPVYFREMKSICSIRFFRIAKKPLRR